MRHVLDDCQIVANEKHREPEFALQVLQQIDDLRLHRHVQRRHGFVADDQIGLGGKRAGARGPNSTRMPERFASKGYAILLDFPVRPTAVRVQACGARAMRPMTDHVFLGMLTPTSTTVLEPVTTTMISGLAEVTAHFSRFKVTEIALSAPALAQFDDSEILRAAELLADAQANVIAW